MFKQASAAVIIEALPKLCFYFAPQFWNIISLPNFIAFPNDARPEQLFCVFLSKQPVSAHWD